MQFSINRLGLLMKKQLQENKKLYLLGTLAMMGIMGLIFMFMAINDNLNIESQPAFLGLGMISFGCLFTLTLFSKLDVKGGRIQSFMLPASHLEKLICAIIYGTFLFPLVYLISVYPVLRIFTYINSYIGNIQQVYVFDEGKLEYIILSYFFILQSLVLFFSVFFRQYKVVKSIVTLCLLFFGTINLAPAITEQFLPFSFKRSIKIEQVYADDKKLTEKGNTKEVNGNFILGANTPFGDVRYFSENTQASLGVPYHQKRWFYFLLYLSIPFMWIITWFRLRESEIS